MAAQRGFLVPLPGPDEYGASVQDNNRRAENWRLQDEQERQILHSDILAKGMELDRAVPVEELVQKLKEGKVLYDEDVVRKVVPEARTADSRVTPRKFIDAFLKRRSELRGNLVASYSRLDTLDRLLSWSEANLNRETAKEPHSLAGPSAALKTEESKLTVQIVSCQNFQMEVEEGTAFKVYLQCQKQEIESKAQIYRNGNVFWNEVFSFQIDSREGDLHITLLKVDFNGKPCGDSCIIIEDLADQKKHELSREIFGAVNCELLLSAQWVYSKKQLYHNYVREYTAKRENELREVSQLHLESQKFEKAITGQDSSGTGMSFGLGDLLEGPEYLSKAIDKAMESLKLSTYQVASQYIVGISLVLCCIASYARPLFLDLQIMGFAFWCNLDPRRWSTRRYLVAIGATVLSMCLDIAWMVNYFPAWRNSTVEADMQNITKIFTIFNFLWKLVMAIFFWKCYYDMNKKNQQRLAASAHHRHNHHEPHRGRSVAPVAPPGATVFV